MGRVSTLILLVFVVLVVLVQEQECRGGRTRGGHRPSGGGTSYKSHPSPSSLSYGSHPSPSPSYPSYNTHHNSAPAPSPGWGTQHGTHGTQLGTQTNRGTPTSRPYGFDVNNNQKTQNNYQTGSQPSAPKGPDVNNRPLGFDNKPGQTGSHQPSAPPLGFDKHNQAAGHPIGSHPPSAPIGFDNHNKQTYHGNTNSQPNRPIGWDIPPRPGATAPGGYHHQPQGPPISNNGYHPYQQYPHQQSYSGPTKVKIVNKYNYHYPGYYSVPQQHSYYPGYFQSTPSYHYSSFDTGSTALGFALGYSLAKLTTPTYSHQSFYDGYRPRYDHYEVHHYYHNRDAVPQNQEIRSNSIVGCVGDAPQVCPVNTTSLCTSNGALMCVVSATSTVPCLDNRQVNCIRSQVSCVNNSAPECKNAQNNEATINIPCISTAKIYGDLKVLNNTIIPKNVENATSANNSTIVTTTPSSALNETVSTQYPITTTPNPSSATPARRRRDADPAQNYCVTIVALPAAKKETEGEKLFKDAKDVTMKFLEKAWGL